MAARRKAKRALQRVSTKTKLVNTLALIIGTAPVIARAKEAVDARALHPLTSGLLEDFTGFDIAGGFSLTRLAKGWGPVLTAIIIKKAMSKIRAGKLII